MTRAIGVIVLLAARTATAQPCDDAITDVVATPLHDAGIDAQRSPCVRDDLEITTLAHALIDTPGFHGLVGGELGLVGRFTVGDHLELGARLRVVDYTFAQTAVNKATETDLGPLVVMMSYGGPIAGARGQLAVMASLELPYTRDKMATVHTSGAIDAVTAMTFGRSLLHARIGVLGAIASSDGGTTERLAFRAGIDGMRRIRTTVALAAGLEWQAGWSGGFDAAIARAGMQKRFGRYRGMLAVGVPLEGNDQTTVVFTFGIARDL